MVKLVLPDSLKPQSPADLPPPGPDGEKPTEIAKPDPKKVKRLIVLSFSILILAVVVVGIWYLQLQGYIGIHPKEQTTTTPATKSAQATTSANSNVSLSLLSTPASFSTSDKLSSGRIVFVRDNDIWTIDANGQRKLTSKSGTGRFGFPLLTSDNSAIVYLSFGQDSTQLQRINYDGSNGKTVISYPNQSSGFDLSTDSRSAMVILVGVGSNTVKLDDLTYNKEIRGVNFPTSVQPCPNQTSTPATNLAQQLGSEDSGYWLDGNHYLFKSGCGQFIVGVDGGQATSINANWVMPSLDYTQFVAGLPSSQGGTLNYYNSDGTLVKAIPVSASLDSAVVSVDKKYIFYTTHTTQAGANGGSSGNASLWRVGTDGSANTKMFDENAYILKLRQFSGDGNNLIYERVGNDGDLYSKIKSGDSSTSDLASITPRIDIYSWDSTSGSKIKLVENGYQAVYSSK